MVYVENELIGKRLHRIRVMNGKGCYEMAKILGISEGHYRKIERGIYGLDLRKVAVLQNAMGINPNYLLSGEDVPIKTLYQTSMKPRERTAVVCEMLQYCKEQLEENQFYEYKTEGK